MTSIRFQIPFWWSSIYLKRDLLGFYLQHIIHQNSFFSFRTLMFFVTSDWLFCTTWDTYVMITRQLSHRIKILYCNKDALGLDSDNLKMAETFSRRNQTEETKYSYTVTNRKYWKVIERPELWIGHFQRSRMISVNATTMHRFLAWVGKKL